MSKKPYAALSIPPGARKNGGTEVLRAGIAEQNLTMSIRRAFDDPAAWGVLLATAGRQVARIYAADLGLAEEEVRAKILVSFENEMHSPEAPGVLTAAS
jgi:Domain of unknown function (DUF5076)